MVRITNKIYLLESRNMLIDFWILLYSIQPLSLFSIQIIDNFFSYVTLFKYKLGKNKDQKNNNNKLGKKNKILKPSILCCLEIDFLFFLSSSSTMNAFDSPKAEILV